MKKLFFEYLKQKSGSIICFSAVCAVFTVFILLYGLPAAAAVYPVLLSFVLFALFFFAGYFRVREKHRLYEDMGKNISEADFQPEEAEITERDLMKLNDCLLSELKRVQTESSEKINGMIEYYTVWVHQIKTPIASMKLILQSDDSEQARKLLSMLTRIEQYAQMVLMYVRLESSESDYVFAKTDIDSLVNRAVKKFSGDFIMKKIKADVQKTGIICVTDEKWLSFVIEQILSNSLKYTENGCISIYSEGSVLCVEDTGIGIAPEDLPRIFEKGYTGYNGRNEKSATGLGLYLCKMITDRLGCSLYVRSTVGKGTTVCLDLSQNEYIFE